MKRRFSRFNRLMLALGLAIAVTLLAAPRSAAAFQHDSDDNRNQAQDQVPAKTRDAIKTAAMVCSAMMISEAI